MARPLDFDSTLGYQLLCQEGLHLEIDAGDFSLTSPHGGVTSIDTGSDEAETPVLAQFDAGSDQDSIDSDRGPALEFEMSTHCSLSRLRHCRALNLHSPSPRTPASPGTQKLLQSEPEQAAPAHLQRLLSSA